jgi:hypothetical protein
MRKVVRKKEMRIFSTVNSRDERRVRKENVEEHPLEPVLSLTRPCATLSTSTSNKPGDSSSAHQLKRFVKKIYL